MLVVETIAKIRLDHLVRGVPIKKIARDLRVSKNTVRKVVRGDETSFSYERKIQPMPKLGPWVEELERQLKANEKKARKDRLSLLRIHEDLGALGYGGGYDAVRRYARTWRRRWRLLSQSQAFVPLSLDPGEAYQFDWSHEYARLSGVTTKVEAAHMRLCYSRMQLVQIFPRESQEMVFEAHERAFRFFGGVCRRGIYDNMKTAVSTVFVGKKRDYNRRFQEMCSHHLVEPAARLPRWANRYPPRGFAPRSARRYTKPRGSPLLATGTTSAVPLRGVNFARRSGVNIESRLTALAQIRGDLPARDRRRPYRPAPDR